MTLLEIVRGIVGFILVFFIPGHALTLALWPKKKKEIYEEILAALKRNDISDVTIAGRPDNLEEMGCLLDDKKIKYQTYNRNEEKPDISIIDNSENLILLDPINVEIDQKNRFIIDLTNSLEKAEKTLKIENTIDGIERFALSFGLSIAVVPLLGFLLDRTGIGIRFGSILASIILVSTILFGVYFYRRRSNGV